LFEVGNETKRETKTTPVVVVGTEGRKQGGKGKVPEENP